MAAKPGVQFSMGAPQAILLARELGAGGPKIRARVKRTVAKHGRLLVTRVKARASGRPGPNAPTGDYRRSWTMQLRQETLGSVAVVGTNKPQGRRLELGFVGQDSLGRTYDQPPYPHVRPAIDDVTPGFQAEMDAIAKEPL